MTNIMSVLGKRKKYVWVIVIVLIIGGYYYYKSRQSTTSQVKYVTATAEKGTLTSSVSASGNVVVDQSSNIDPTISGTVADLSVAVGDSVKKGQLLFTIINEDLTVSVAKSTASLKTSKDAIEVAQVSVKSAKADYNAAKKKEDKTPGTYTNKELSVMKDKIDLAEDDVAEAEKNYIASQADYSNTLTNAGKRSVTALLDGTVNAVNIKNGDDLSKVSSGSSRQVPIIIGDLGTMKAQVQVNEVDIANVSIGQKVMMKMDALNNFETTGIVEKMDSLGTLTSGVVTYNVTIDFDSLDPRIKPEMSVSASIITDVKQDVITVPSSAVKIQNGTNYVEVLNGATPEQKNVTVGTSNSTDTEIVGGINVGDKVVTQTINSSSTSSASASSTSRTGGSSSGGLRLPGLGGGGRPD
jgi:RND family efflux transporter MFP subunit